MKTTFKLATLAASLLLAHAAQATNTFATTSIQTNPALPSGPEATTGNTSAPSNWRFAPGQTIGGVAGALDGVARLSFTTSAGSYACSGSLLANGGGLYVLTAAHCADDYLTMNVSFGWYNGVAAVTRSVGTVEGVDKWVHPLWNGTLDTGADIAILKLDSAVTTIQGYALSQTLDVGKVHLMAGYGTTQQADVNSATNWNDRNYGHYGWNTFDVTSQQFGTAVFGDDPSFYAPGVTYMVDFDRSSAANPSDWNVLQRVANANGNGWTSDNGLGADEALIAGGDSGGGDYVFDAANNRFLLSAVHSWGWNRPCNYFGFAECNSLGSNTSSYGDLSGSTAVYSHLNWINSITGAVPEPETYALLLAGLGVVGSVARRRKSA